MKESEYIIATNRAKISLALSALTGVLAGDGYGVSRDEIKDIIKGLYSIESRLFDLIDTEDDNPLLCGEE